MRLLSTLSAGQQLANRAGPSQRHQSARSDLSMWKPLYTVFMHRVTVSMITITCKYPTQDLSLFPKDTNSGWEVEPGNEAIVKLHVYTCVIPGTF